MGPGAGAIFSSGMLGSAPEKMGTWAHRAESTPGGCEEWRRERKRPGSLLLGFKKVRF